MKTSMKEVMKHHQDYLTWLESLKETDENWFHAPIGEGKWSPSAIISHIMFWDVHCMDEKFPMIGSGNTVKDFPPFETVNQAAWKYAKDKKSEELIEEGMSTRMKLIQKAAVFKEEDLDVRFKVGSNEMTLAELFLDFIWHDKHHMNQVDQFLKTRTGG
ncbi:DinB family protein [Falsibacillus pallidus]|uniref:Putative damage-inducible protein DinB n=1 Tax=Falsibacillus pallidus TaxID=493781 RepID=A0A370GVE6_9BACI|nr:DinB family protein [Falsibacillus pallidus]RDI47652.1 putative damage-inducible protein DinB [Falsibacillus pallidus]